MSLGHRKMLMVDVSPSASVGDTWSVVASDPGVVSGPSTGPITKTGLNGWSPALSPQEPFYVNMSVSPIGWSVSVDVSNYFGMFGFYDLDVGPPDSSSSNKWRCGVLVGSSYVRVYYGASMILNYSISIAPPFNISIEVVPGNTTVSVNGNTFQLADWMGSPSIKFSPVMLPYFTGTEFSNWSWDYGSYQSL